jgi:hypothetical protein
VHCIERGRLWAAAGVAVGLVACSVPRVPDPASVPSSQSSRTAPTAPGARARNWDEYRMQEAQRLAAANPGVTYSDAVPDPLLAIPVLEIELNRDGSIRRISVQRTPTQAADTVQIAIDAVRRAAPYGDVSHLPQPWRYSEVFLFRDDRRFKPRLLDN